MASRRNDGRTHYLSRQSQRTPCGRAVLRYASNGSLVSQLTVTSDPTAVTCVVCQRHPEPAETSVWLAENRPDIIGIFSAGERAERACQDAANKFLGPHGTPMLTWQGSKGYHSAAYHHPVNGMTLFQVTRFTVDEASTL